LEDIGLQRPTGLFGRYLPERKVLLAGVRVSSLMQTENVEVFGKMYEQNGTVKVKCDHLPSRTLRFFAARRCAPRPRRHISLDPGSRYPTLLILKQKNPRPAFTHGKLMKKF